MSRQVPRRSLLAGAAAAGVVVAFDPTGGWVTAASAEPGAIRVPDLDGELVLEPGPEYAEDWGLIVHRSPRAVLRPGSVSDVQRMVRFANEQCLRVAMRGQGHSAFGQAQAEAGVVIDSRTLATMHQIGAAGAVVDAGVTWHDLVQASVAVGLTPPVNTDYLGLSVGGTLSVGGIGGASSHFGLQVDNVLALEVVTGDGRLVRCSPRENADLFGSVLGGLGQFAIIVRATVRLVPAKQTARVYRLGYTDLATFTADQRLLLADGRFDYLEGQAVPVDGGGWSYLLEAAAYYTAPAPDDARLLRGLRHGSAEIVELPYVAWLDRIYEIVEQLRAMRLPNPWINLFLPAEHTDSYVARMLAELTPADTGGGVVLLYPVPTRLLTRRFVRVPRGEVMYLLAILRMVIPANDAEAWRLVAQNKVLYDRARAIGGTHYPVGAIPLGREDWARHYGEQYPALVTAKNRYDPRRVLTPGQGIF